MIKASAYSDTSNPAGTHWCADEEAIARQVNHQGPLTASTGPWKLGDFEPGICLFYSNFVNVYSARERESGFIVALKAISKMDPRFEANDCQHEFSVQTSLDHEHILQAHALFEDEKHVYIVLDYAPGEDLKNKLKKIPNAKGFSEEEAAGYIIALAKALEHCHSRNVIHCDIKPENVLIGADGKLKLADFGISTSSLVAKSDKGLLRSIGRRR
jgi:serine/threonine protein kinase